MTNLERLLEKYRYAETPEDERRFREILDKIRKGRKGFRQSMATVPQAYSYPMRSDRLQAEHMRRIQAEKAF